MSDFPLDEKARDELRAEILDEYMERAYLKAKDHMRSLRCIKGDHRCLNSGLTCLCLCHDRKQSNGKESHAADGRPGTDIRDDPNRSWNASRAQARANSVFGYIR